MKSIIVSILVCFFIVASGLSAFGEEWTAEQKEVWSLVVADVENFKKGNFEMIMENRHDDFISWWFSKASPSNEVMFPYQYKGWVLYEVPKNWELNPLSIKILGNNAIVTYKYKRGGVDSISGGRSFDVFLKQNTKWLLFGHIGTSCIKPATCNIEDSGSKAFVEEMTAEQKEVWEAVVADIDNFKTGNVEKILGARHDDFILWWNNKLLPFDKELARYNYKGWFGYEIPKNWELNPLAVKISGNIAIVAWTYKISGEKFSENGRSFDVWIKQNNKWVLWGSTSASCEKPALCQ